MCQTNRRKEESFMDKAKSRKFILASVSLIGSFAALFTGFIDGATLIGAFGAIFAFYGTSSAVEKNIRQKDKDHTQ